MDANHYDARMLSPQAKEALRLRVAQAVVDQGMRQKDAVRHFRVSRTAVHNWSKAYRAGGRRALKARKLGAPRRSRLAGHQAATAVRMITDRCPDQYKLPFALWTREAAQTLLREPFGVDVSVWTVGRYLKRWNLTPQKPLRRAYERDPAAVQRWLDEEYPAIRRRAKREKAEIHWGDQMGLRSDHQAGTSYGRRGRTPVVPGTGKRFGCNMMSTITNRGTLRFMVFKSRFNTPVMIEFLRRLIRSVNRKVFLIVDGHPVHRSRKLKRWLAERSEAPELFYLPAYSPELNPDELLNQDVKTNAVGRERPANQHQMINQVRSYLRATQRDPELVQRYFLEEHVRYAADPSMFTTRCSR